MKVIVLSTLLSILSTICIAQTKSVMLDGVTVTPVQYTRHKKKVRAEHVYLRFSKHEDLSKPGNWDSTFFLTKFPKLEDYPIRIHSVDLRLAPFDTSLMDMSFVLFQINGKDTSMTTVDIDEVEKIRKNKLTLHFNADDRMIIQPNEFYMGYTFHAKKIPSDFDYRLYSSAKGGEGVLLNIRNGKMGMVRNPHMHEIFPFTLEYEKMQ